jgi:hypothetical protein
LGPVTQRATLDPPMRAAPHGRWPAARPALPREASRPGRRSAAGLRPPSGLLPGSLHEQQPRPPDGRHRLLPVGRAALVPSGPPGRDAGVFLFQQPPMDPGQHDQMVAIELAIGWVPGIGLQGGPMVRSALQEQPSLLVLRRLSVAAALRQTPGSRPEAAPHGRAERPSCAAALSYAIYPMALIAQLVAGQNEAPAMFLLSRWRVSRVSRFTSLVDVASKRPTPTDGLQAVRCQRR